MTKKWTVGTRGSKLALKQAEIAIGVLTAANPGHEFHVKTITTKGDTIWDRPLHLIGGKGLFVKEIEEEMIRGTIDLAVHSMKDLPTELGEGLIIGAVLEREDPRDALLSHKFQCFNDLPQNAKVGTNSLRRIAQILHLKPSLAIVPLRGNIDTRMRKLRELDLDGIILARAGVKRLGLDKAVSEILPFEIMVPAAGQGGIGIETRKDPELMGILGKVSHSRSYDEIAIERRLQIRIGGSCQVPLGIHAALDGNSLVLTLAFGNEDGRFLVKERLTGSISDSHLMIDEMLSILEKRGAPIKS